MKTDPHHIARLIIIGLMLAGALIVIINAIGCKYLRRYYDWRNLT
jgi:hypothetical protein